MGKQDAFLSIPQVAEILGLHPESVRKLVRQGRIPAFKVGRSWRFHREELDAWRQNTAPRSAPRQLRVLVVDDEESFCRTTGRVLQRLGFEAQTALNGEEGLARIQESRPDVILLDLVMPGMSGPQFLAEARRVLPSTPVVIVTGFPDSPMLKEAMRHPPVMLLAKPIETEDLQRTLNTITGPRSGAHLEERPMSEEGRTLEESS